MSKQISLWVVILSSIAVLHVLSGPPTPRLDEDDLLLERRELLVEEEVPTSTEDMGTAPPIETGEAIGPTLGDILSKFSLVILIIYAVGIAYKLVKIHKGEYIREDPIYLKYK